MRVNKSLAAGLATALAAGTVGALAFAAPASAATISSKNILGSPVNQAGTTWWDDGAFPSPATPPESNDTITLTVVADDDNNELDITVAGTEGPNSSSLSALQPNAYRLDAFVEIDGVAKRLIGSTANVLVDTNTPSYADGFSISASVASTSGEHTVELTDFLMDSAGQGTPEPGFGALDDGSDAGGFDAWYNLGTSAATIVARTSPIGISETVTIDAPAFAVTGTANNQTAPFVGRHGDTYPIELANFAPNAEVTISGTQVFGAPANHVIGTVTTDGDGAFVGSTPPIPNTVPTGLPWRLRATDGTNTVTIADNSGIIALFGDPTIAVTSPMTVGTEYTVTGTNWDAGQTVDIELTGGTSATSAAATVGVGFATGGAIPAGTTITPAAGDLPATAITATQERLDESTLTATAAVEVQAAPAFTITGNATNQTSPTAVRSGDSFPIALANFEPDTEITIQAQQKFAGTAVVTLGTVMTDADGNYAGPSPAIVGAPAPFGLCALDGDTQVCANNTLGMLGTPTVVVPAAMNVGTEYTITGTNWNPAQDVTIELKDASDNVVRTLTTTASSSGAASGNISIAFTPAEGDVAAVSATASQAHGATTLTATVSPIAIAVAPPALTITGPATHQTATGAVRSGDAFPITLANFEPSTEITIVAEQRFTGSNVVTLGTVTTDANGAYTGDSPAISGAPAPFALCALDGDTSVCAAGTLGELGTPTLIAPAEMDLGTEYNITGTYWNPDQEVTVELKDADGNVVQTLTGTPGTGISSGQLTVTYTPVAGDEPIVSVVATQAHGTETLTATVSPVKVGEGVKPPVVDPPVVNPPAKDTTAPVAKVTKPAKKKAKSAKAWKKIKGTVTDADSGPKSVTVKLIQKAGKKWKFFNGKKWKNAKNKKQALKKAKALTDKTVSSGKFSIKVKKPAKKSKLIVQFWAADNAGNTAKKKTVSQKITKK